MCATTWRRTSGERTRRPGSWSRRSWPSWLRRDETLRTIARELVVSIKRNLTIDWTIKESVRASLRATVKRLLRKYGYPPDKQEKATQTVIEQAELLCRDWAA